MKMRVELLDHGYIEFIESWGSDQRIVETARMSTGKGFLGWDPGPCPECNGKGTVREDGVRIWSEKAYPEHLPDLTIVHRGHWTAVETDVPCRYCEGKGQILGDQKLLKFLYDKKHSSPFEFAGMTIEVQAPIMVYREWHRHRTQAYSELSARYTPLPDQNYLPTPTRCLQVSGTNKQAGKAKGAAELTHEAALEWLDELYRVYEHAEIVYQRGLAIGIPKELARLPVPVGRYSRMRATGNLRNWLLFLTLRQAPDAQWEIRQFANALEEFIGTIFPRTHRLFVDGAES